jgi:hypothetical protein
MKTKTGFSKRKIKNSGERYLKKRITATNPVEIRCCAQKRRHETRSIAKKHLKNMRGVHGRVYKCRFCKGYHITTKV